jgi:hypothetical protein
MDKLCYAGVTFSGITCLSVSNLFGVYLYLFITCHVAELVNNTVSRMGRYAPYVCVCVCVCVCVYVLFYM